VFTGSPIQERGYREFFGMHGWDQADHRYYKSLLLGWHLTVINGKVTEWSIGIPSCCVQPSLAAYFPQLRITGGMAEEFDIRVVPVRPDLR
jgi:hypothetical protein